MTKQDKFSRRFKNSNPGAVSSNIAGYPDPLFHVWITEGIQPKQQMDIRPKEKEDDEDENLVPVDEYCASHGGVW